MIIYYTMLKLGRLLVIPAMSNSLAAPKYRSLGQIPITKNINVLQFGAECRLLAGGGCDGLVIWEVEDLHQVYKRSAGVRGSITALSWVNSRTLVFGTSLGSLVVCKDEHQGWMECYRHIISDSEVTSITSSLSLEGVERVATVQQNGGVQVFTVDESGGIHQVFSVQMEAPTVPIGVVFARLDAYDVYVFGLHDGLVLLLDGHRDLPGTKRSVSERQISARHLGGPIGHVQLIKKSRTQYFVVDNVTAGFSLYNLDTLSLVKEYFSEPKTSCPKQVGIGERGKIIVGGSDVGVHIFNRKSGQVIEVLAHNDDNPTLIQTIAVGETDTSTVIASSAGAFISSDKKFVHGSVQIWINLPLEVAEDQDVKDQHSFGFYFGQAVICVLLIGAFVRFGKIVEEWLSTRAEQVWELVSR